MKTYQTYFNTLRIQMHYLNNDVLSIQIPGWFNNRLSGGDGDLHAL